MLKEVILSVLLGLEPAGTDADEPPEARRARMAEFAGALAVVLEDEPEPLHWAAALLSIATHESRLARYVVEGRCAEGPPGARCDWLEGHGPRARGAFQLWSWCRTAWLLSEPSPAGYVAQGYCALRQAKLAKRRCRTLRGMFSGYRKLSDCAWAGAGQRVETYVRLRRQIQRAWTETIGHGQQEGTKTGVPDVDQN